MILDTNVVSELLLPKTSAAVYRWLSRQRPEAVFTTVITEAELCYGVAILPAGRRREALRAAINGILEESFRQRILFFDRSAARAFSEISSARRSMGRPISALDAQIAAIALSRSMPIATRNTRDFEHCGVTLINPWVSK